jgi:hypothetical protein
VHNAQAQEKDTKVPSLEFLEFLGEWTDDEKHWVDPLLMKQLEDPKTDANTKQGDKHE